MPAASLRAHRRSLTAAWERFQERGSADGVRDEVAASWDRSQSRLPGPVEAAPVDPEDTVRDAWRASALRPAMAGVVEDVERTARDCDLVAAVTDATGRILWSSGGRHMRDRAAAVNFVPGGRWDEASVGTNALDLALRSAEPAQVFSAEHFSPAVHGWVCYAAPLVDPSARRVVGVLDLSTTWDRSHPMALATVTAFARTISQALGSATRRTQPTARHGDSTSPTPDRGALRLEVLGRPRLWVGATPVMLTQRQAEVLLALASHPQGCTLDQLAAHVYGDQPVAATTVKVEVSRLRRVVPGALASRPYRLSEPLAVDALEVLEHIAAGDAPAAARAFVDDVLPGSEAPVARELAVRIQVGVRTLVLAGREPDAASTLAQRDPHDADVVEHALALLPGDAPERALLEGARAAALLD
ncbi:MAG: winged helix-turn-helix domain-containing protein [Candidatus Nanopelagicales bacterium]|nr:winged helix-turn-helix domain-containing protein [Candidatus Nanopelagicales bacterium]